MNIFTNILYCLHPVFAACLGFHFNKTTTASLWLLIASLVSESPHFFHAQTIGWNYKLTIQCQGTN